MIMTTPFNYIIHLIITSVFSRRRIIIVGAATPRVMLVLFFLSAVNCSPPEDPIHCAGKSPAANSNCTITNSYGAFPDRSICRASKAVYPSSESELISAVAEAAAAVKKMKVATRYSHSTPKLVCPGGDDGVIISTKRLNRTLEVDPAAMTMTVESGATLGQLIADAAAAGMALPYAPYWLGLTVGGMLGTGAHGSSLWGLGSGVHDHVIRLRVVSAAGADDGYAKVRVLESGNPDLNAAKVSLGVLGVISQVTFKLQQMFKRSVTYITKDDSTLGDEAVSFGKLHEFADFTWYPSQKQVVYRVDDRVPTNTSGNGVIDFPGFRSTPTLLLSSVRTLEEMQESIGDIDGKCTNGKLTASTMRASAYGLTNDGILFKGYPVIGYHNRIQASGGCLNSVENAMITACPWDHRINGLFFHQTTFSVALTKVRDFINDVKNLVSLEPKSTCGLDLYNGILARYVKSSTAYLGKQEDSLDFDMSYYRSKDPRAPRLFENILEEIEQMAFFKYNALPHWGKNRHVAFRGVINKYKNRGEFIRVKEMYDPMGLFSSDWTDWILGLKDGLFNEAKEEGCALEGLCICSQDSHCAPNKGYFCRQGKVYKEARVCSKAKMSEKRDPL